MRKKERANIAATAHQRNYNCAQSVLMAYPELFQPDDEAIFRLASGFGGGMGRLQEACGAVTGGFMVIGLKMGSRFPDDERKEIIVRHIQEFVRRFREIHGTIKCYDLIGVDLNTEEGRAEQKSPRLREKVCEKCVMDAVNILEDIFSE